MKIVKKSIVIFLSLTIALLTTVTGLMPASAQGSSNIGLCAHCFTAYREGWSYVWGASSYGAVDCSGLIWSYNGVGGIRTDMLAASNEWGYVYNGIPNIHGLGLHHPGHVGVYVGSGMAIDAQSPSLGIGYHNAYSASWVEWFKIYGVSYPYQGWVRLNGESFYYENGQYLANTSRTLDGVTYTFDWAGVSNINPPESAYSETDYSAPTYSYSQSNSYSQSDSYYEESSSYAETYSQVSYQEESSYAYTDEYYRGYEEYINNYQESSQEESHYYEEPSKAPEPSVVEQASVEPVKEESKQESKKEESKEESKKEEPKKEEPKKEESKVEESSVEAVEEVVELIAEYGYQDDDESKTVSAIQTRLYELGYIQYKSTGIFDDATTSAVMLFQSKNDLEVTGMVDSKTYRVLKSDEAQSNFSILSNGTFDEAGEVPVTSLQTRLTELEYYYDDITGFYSELTASAVRQFQKDNKIKSTGIADVDTQLRIFSSKAKKNPNAGSAVYGASGALVTKMQKRLVELRYLSGIVSEKFDDSTLAAVHAFQKAAGFEESDMMTAEQLELLYSDKAIKSPDFDVLKYGYAGDDVAQLQSRLAALNYYDGKTSGVYNNTVVEAVEKFQSDNNMDVTGNVDEKTLELIKAEAQKETAHIGETIVLKTAAISDEALAGIADSKNVSLTVDTTEESNPVRDTLVLSSVLIAASALMIFFTKYLKKDSKKMTEI